jgi:TIR domain
MQKVFISYARPDVDLAMRVFDELQAIKNIEPWFDKHSLLPGIKWRPAIRKAIREANYFLALISSRSASGRGYRNTELDQALEILKEFPPDQTFFIPARLDECDMPRDELSELNWIDLFPDWNQGMGRLVSFLAPNGKSSADCSLDSKINKVTPSYHYRVGLVDLDLGLTNLKSIAQSLNETQSFFHFTCPELPSVKRAIVQIGGFKNLAIFRIPSSFFAEHPNLTVDLVACLTRYPLAFEEDNKILYNYFAGPSDEDERFLFVSTDQLYGFCKQAGRTFEQGLIYTLIGQLACYFSKIGYHPEIRGCVMDFCEIRTDQILGLKSQAFCNSCNNLLPTGNLKSSLEALLSWNY